MGEYINGYEAHEIIRKNAGSPAVYFIFSKRTNSVLIDNLGSTSVYFKFDSIADIGSSSGVIPAYQARVLDVRIGSVSILGSGATTPEIQCMSLR